MVELVEEKAGPEGEIMVSRAGSGPALVLIHGITSGRWTWGSVVDRLAEDYELFIYDQRGHGQSQKPNHGYQLSDYAGDLDIVLDHFGIARPLIIGHSLGGMVTLEWAIGQPDRAKAIVIEDSLMRRGGDETGELFDGWIALNNMTREEIEAAYLANEPDITPEDARVEAESMAATAPGVLLDLRDAMKKHHGETVIDSYREITSPALLVYGDVEAGGMVPQVDAVEFADVVPNGKIANIAGGSHGLHRERTDDFLAAVLPFLEAHRA
ncbi:MAG: alpha/beta hydrolase [Thermomicrobiales bacterium]